MKKKTKITSFDTDVNNTSMPLTGYVGIDNLTLRRINCECGIEFTTTYLTIKSHRNSITGKCCPTRTVLQRELNISQSTLGKYIDTLVDKGYLIVNSGRTGSASNYYFPHDKKFHVKQNEREYITSMNRATKTHHCAANK